MGYSASAVYVQQDFKSTFIALKNEYCYIGAVIDYTEFLKACDIKGKFFKRHRDLYRSKEFKFKQKNMLGYKKKKKKKNLSNTAEQS